MSSVHHLFLMSSFLDSVGKLARHVSIQFFPLDPVFSSALGRLNIKGAKILTFSPQNNVESFPLGSLVLQWSRERLRLIFQIIAIIPDGVKPCVLAESLFESEAIGVGRRWKAIDVNGIFRCA